MRGPVARLFWMSLTIILPLASCSSPGSDLPPLPPSQDSSMYHLGPGDKLVIKVLGADELNGQYEIQSNGTIRMLLIGEVPAAGMTVEGLEDEITDKLKAGSYLKQPYVAASIVTYRPFYILGEVTKPGVYPYATGMRVLSAVAAAQGYTYRANTHYVIITRKGKDSRADVMSSIQPDDIIRVPERYF